MGLFSTNRDGMDVCGGMDNLSFSFTVSEQGEPCLDLMKH